jgi:peptidoglycan/xylan/chitin deacetylase (PgdA/CDA1 family)
VRLLKILVSAGVSLFDAIRRTGFEPRIVVLYYHAIPAGKRRAFARQMDALQRLCVPVRADAAEAGVSPRSAAVTFDDAFVSVIENALPELKSRNIPCTIFVPTGSMGGPARWLPAGHSDAGEMVACPTAVKSLAADGLVTIGSHSVTHPNFRLLNEGPAFEELTQSKKELEAITGRAVRTFSFPHGACNGRAFELARQAGYDRVFTIEPRLARFGGGEFVCGRVKVEPDDWSIEFRLKVTGAYRWLSVASAWKARLLGRTGRAQVSARSAV